MDRYQASVQSVDAALRRLNATLATYKIQDGSTTHTPKNPAAGSRSGSGVNVGNGTTSHVDNVGTASSDSERGASDEALDKVWFDLLDLRSTQHLPEVRSL